VKNLILFRVSDSEESPQETLPLRFAKGQGDKEGVIPSLNSAQRLRERKRPKNLHRRPLGFASG